MAQAAIPLWVQYAGAATAAVGTGVQIQQTRAAQRSAEKADAAGRAGAEIANQRSIRKNTVAARVLRANALASGGAQGGGFGDSSVQGAVGSIGAQAGSNQGFARTQLATGNAIARLNSQSRGHQANAATFGTIAALPGQFGFDVASVFKQGTDQSDVVA